MQPTHLYRGSVMQEKKNGEELGTKISMLVFKIVLIGIHFMHGRRVTKKHGDTRKRKRKILKAYRETV